ncbi:MAG: peptidylprolyl isomerase [Chitinophagaceae bacterium]
MKYFLSVIVCTLLISAASAQTQATGKVVADKIVGIIGDKIVLRSDVFNEIDDRKRNGMAVGESDHCDILAQLLQMKALVLQAERDSLLVSDDELEGELDNRIRAFVSRYGSKEALEEIAGKTVYQIKEMFRQSIKEQKMARRMSEKIVENIKITPQEVKEYFDKIPKDSLLFYESEISVGEIVLYPKASRDLEKMAQDELNDFKRQIESGERKMETLASLYSDDPSSKENKGRFAINRTEKVMDPSFIANAFRLREGQVSPVFKSKFGYHIIQMESRAGDDAVVRHILRIPKITQEETDAAAKKLDSVRSMLIAGTIGFGEAVSRYSEDEDSKFTGGMKSNLTMDQLDKDMVEMLAKSGLKPGEYSKPTPYVDMRQKQGVRIVYLKSRTEPHRENMKDDYDRVAQRALDIKKQAALDKWFATKIPTFYMMIDDEFRTCNSLHNWIQYAAKSGQ